MQPRLPRLGPAAILRGGWRGYAMNRQLRNVFLAGIAVLLLLAADAPASFAADADLVTTSSAIAAGMSVDEIVRPQSNAGRGLRAPAWPVRSRTAAERGSGP